MIVANSKTCVSEKLRMAIFFAQPKGNYYPFGKEARGSSTPNEPKEQFTGKERDIETGLDYFGARYYNADIGRFMSLDPIRSTYPYLTPYAYVANNPVFFTDPTGQYMLSVHYQLTYDAMQKFGISKSQSDLVAHYASVWVDNPGAAIVAANNAVAMLKPGVSVLNYRSGIDYSETINSQSKTDPFFNVWHSMRTNVENWWLGVSSDDAMARGQEFGWNKIFEAAKGPQGLENIYKNSDQIEDLAWGLHALQDSYAHGGADWDEHSKRNDIWGNTNYARNVTESALAVFQILRGNFKSIKGGMKLDLSGMSTSQQNSIYKKLRKAGYTLVIDGQEQAPQNDD